MPSRRSSRSLIASSRSCISSAARQARSASSSCASGTPNTATTASPMNFSTVPPCRSSAAAHLVEVRAHQLLHRLRVDPLAHRRRPGHVAEHEVASLRRSGAGAAREAPQ